MNLSPILLYVYNRPQHLKRCVESLLAISPSAMIYVYNRIIKNI